jgi:phenylalanyl-tRNA synthetase beta chain
MRVPISWLQDYVNISLPADELAERLTMAGTEAGEIDVVGANWEGVGVAQVVGLEGHPDADRLQLATVDLGEERMTVVTGAPNLEEGQKVPFARVGAQLIDGHTGKLEKLKPAKIRGVRSEGMVCSEKELGISDRHEGIMVLPADAPVGVPLAEYMGDTIFDLSTTPNRPDCLSVIGIAREVAALTGQVVSLPDVQYDEPEPAIGEWITVEIADPDLCPRYCASLVKGVKIGQSPEWMQQRLIASGLRPISNVVDITNYVMLEYGQPLHAFDYHQIKGQKIIVRRARDGETLYTLDGVKRDLRPDMLVIADESEAIALAGVMGGADSEVIDTTTTILLESANFNGPCIRRTSGRLGLRSEASSRFEKSISPDLAPVALRHATELLVQLAGGRAAKGIADAYPVVRQTEPIIVPRERIARILGMEVDGEIVVRVLSSLGFTSEPAGAPGDLSVAVPYWRTDVRLADDVIEEVARVTGYDDIPTTMLRGEVPEHAPATLLALKETIRDLLVSCGVQEVITYSLTGQATLDKIDPASTLGPALRVANPMTQEQEYLRTSLRGGLLACLAGNERYEQGGIMLFEVGKVYLRGDDGLPEEKEMLAGIMGGPRLDRSWLSGEGTLGFFDAKGIVETLLGRLRIEAKFEHAEDPNLSPGRTAVVVAGGQRIGVVGEVHPKTTALFDISREPVILFELEVDSLLSLMAVQFTYEPVSRYPDVIRDLALVMDADVPANVVEAIIGGFPLVNEVSLFDVYSGDKIPSGKKSLAFSVRFRSPERTLTDEEVDRAQGKIVDRLQRELGAALRT